jgi:CHAD domain
VKARRVKKLDPRASLAENAARIVRVRVEELRSFVPDALDPEATRAQHDMRIAAKRLRYVLEAAGFTLGPPAATARRRARDLQDVLGELHDCDVMLPRVETHLAQMRRDDARAVRARAGDAPDLDPRLVTRAPHRTAYRGLEVLAVYLQARRELLFDRFRELWDEFERRRVFERLDRAARERIESARELRSASERAAKAAAELATAEQAERRAVERARRLDSSVPRRSGGSRVDQLAPVRGEAAPDDRAEGAAPAGDDGGTEEEVTPTDRHEDGDRAQVPRIEPA